MDHANSAAPPDFAETSSPRSGRERILALDAFRGLCALLVFLAHWNLWCAFTPAAGWPTQLREGLMVLDTWYRALMWNTGGCHPAVVTFFMLSGYCIHQPQVVTAVGSHPDFSTRRFLFRRSLRIIPVYLYASLLGLGVCLLQSAAPVTDPFVQYHSTFTGGELVLRFTSLSSVWPSQVMSGNNILGSVAAEIALYCTYPFVLRSGLMRRGAILLTVCALMQIIVVRLAPETYLPWAYNSPMMLAFFFYLGATLARVRPNQTFPNRTTWLLAAGTWLLFIAVREGPEFRHRVLLLQALWALCCGCILVGWLGLKGEICTTISRPLAWVGRASYSLYATHSPAIFLSTWLLLSLGLGDYLLQLSLALALSVLLTTLGYRYLESPYARARRRGAI